MDLNAKDTKFLTDMIEHHAMGVKMSEKYAKARDDGGPAPVLKLADSIVTHQNAEIAKMKKWLADAGDADAAAKKNMPMSERKSAASKESDDVERVIREARDALQKWRR